MLTAQKKLRSWRRQAGETMQDAAARFGVSAPTWHHWERGTRLPKPAAALELEAFTECAVTVQDWAASVAERYVEDCDG